jgi:hypothetical protein
MSWDRRLAKWHLLTRWNRVWDESVVAIKISNLGYRTTNFLIHQFIYKVWLVLKPSSYLSSESKSWNHWNLILQFCTSPFIFESRVWAGLLSSLYENDKLRRPENQRLSKYYCIRLKPRIYISSKGFKSTISLEEPIFSTPTYDFLSLLNTPLHLYFIQLWKLNIHHNRKLIAKNCQDICRKIKFQISAVILDISLSVLAKARFKAFLAFSSMTVRMDSSAGNHTYPPPILSASQA